MSSKTALEIAAEAAQGFVVLQCEECARNVKAALLAVGYHGQLLEIRTGSTRDFMACISHDGGRMSITQNGQHLAVRVDDWVFDNLHPDGMPFDQWLKDFAAFGGIKIKAPIDF
ncbi:MAG TPA: papain fold toxin domain-containing protein [Gemmataceae bacterium]|nr:papain fold toxin domain-containing protein [Gemmataceae bacterium]